jgi:hypothetical protein
MLVVVFFYVKQIVHHEFVPPNTIVSSWLLLWCIETLERNVR